VGVHDDPVLGAALRDETQMLPTTGRPEDIAAAVAFLASAEAAFITGVTLHVDGGSAAKASVSGTTFVQWRAGLAAQAGA
jgi:NAD(P)-dependent dehydrogenase (short-subunit alcohol dehydrogenase family)